MKWTIFIHEMKYTLIHEMETLYGDLTSIHEMKIERPEYMK